MQTDKLERLASIFILVTVELIEGNVKKNEGCADLISPQENDEAI